MGLVVISGIALALVGAVLYVVGLYNGLVSLKHDVDRSWANIDVLLKQRADELPKLVDTVKGFMAHEKSVLEGVIAARGAFDRARTQEEKGAADAAAREAVSRLFAVAEAYPQLRSSESFQQLQGRISLLEEGIADRREFFNHSVNALNVRIEQVPDVFVAQWMGLGPRALFQATPDEKKDVKIKFD
ncbi:MAG TPA: LemA family protein [Myxococcota bacterium]|jgi:LemA protein|nr:LemA family protein [Myxococcota bacterium]